MSHFSRIKTQIVSKEFLLLALKDLGYTAVETDKIGGFFGERANVELKISLGLGREVGFRKDGNAYTIVADWWGLGGNKKKDFVQNLLQRYAYLVTMAKLQEQGFSVVTEDKESDGRVHLVLRRVA